MPPGPVPAAREHHVCGVCGHAGEAEVYAAREMMFGLRDRFDYFLCPACGCLQIAQVPEDLSRYYPPDYYSFSPPVERPATLGNWLRRRRNAHAHGSRNLIGAALARIKDAPRLRLLEGVNVSPASRILEVGCGSGRLLLLLHHLGFTDLTGVDPFVPQSSTPRKGVRIVKGTLADLGGVFDLIVFDRSFEHLPDPLDVLRLTAERLRPGGWVLIRVPVVPCFAWETYGTDWVQLDAPRHLFIYSVEGLRLAAERAGLRLETVDHDSTAFQFVGSEKYRRDIPGIEPLPAGSFSPDDVDGFRRRAAELNAEGRGDQARFVLRKR